MVSITLSVPEETRKTMKKFSEVNWSGFVRKSIEEKTKELLLKDRMLKELEKEEDFVNWAVKLQHSSRANRINELKRKGLI
ncbi:MAG: hypothetical protein AABW56_03910 [Nanoarchaeota archaeon]